MPRPNTLVLALLCVALSLGATEPSAAQQHWWRATPEPVVFAVGPDFGSLKADRVKLAGKWKLTDIGGAPAVVENGRLVFVLQVMRPALEPPCAIEAELRFAPGGAVELFAVSPRPAEQPPALLCVTSSGKTPFEVGVIPRTGGNNLLTHILHDPAGRLANLEMTTSMNWMYDRTQYDRYALKPRLDTWPENVRKAHEQELSRIPDLFHRWTRLRIQCLPGFARFYVDGRFIAEAPCRLQGSNAAVKLVRGCALRSLTVRKIARPDPRFYTIDLRGHLNANVAGPDADAGDGAAIEENSLPKPGLCDVQGTPFRFSSDGPADAVDVGKSLWRWGRNSMSRNAQIYSSALKADPRKVKFSVPNRFYSELRLVCFSDTAPGQTRTLTTRLFEPPWGYAADFATPIPAWNAPPAPQAAPLPVRVKKNGKELEGRLWLVRIPLDPCKARDFIADPARPSLNIELTKEVHLIRSYPDPFVYDKFPVGLPTAAHVLAATLVRTPVEIRVEPEKACWLFERPEVPTFRLSIKNFLAPAHEARVRLEAHGFYGASASREFALPVPAPDSAPDGVSYTLALPVEDDDHYKLSVRVSGPGYDLTWPTTFVMLPPDTRKAWGWNSPFGVWRAHHRGMPVSWQIAFDRRVGIRWAGPHPDSMSRKLIHEAQLTPAYARGLVHPKFQPDRPDKGIPAMIDEAADLLRFERARAGVYNLFWEDNISLPLNVCVPPEFMGLDERKMTDEEKARFDMMWDTAVAFGKLLREKLPQIDPKFKKKKIAFGNTGAQFILPFIKRGFPKEYIDFFGLDIPFFERMPERPPRAIELNELYFLKETARKYGYDDVPLCGTEYMAYPKVPGSLTGYEAACYTVRNFSIAMAAYGVQYFFSASCPAQAGNWYGRQHYGGSGYLKRAPELNPSLAAAAYATYTRIFDSPRHDTWAVHPTGSLSAFAASCLRRFRPGRVLVMWTIRGERPAAIVLKRDTDAVMTQMTGRSTGIQSRDKRIHVTLKPDPIYVEFPTLTRASDIERIELGPPEHHEKPAEGFKVVEDFESGFNWQPTGERRESFETVQITQPRFKGRLVFTRTKLTGRNGMGLKCLLPADQPHDPKVAPLYAILRHKQGGIELPGKPTKIGMWCRGNSSWVHIIPVLVDSKGERWSFTGNPLRGKYKSPADQTEITTKGGEGWNSEDIHSWSSVNFDGWRYIEIELPSTFPGDNARGPGQVWWRDEGGDNIVDYPLKLVELIVEMYTGVVYMGEWVPIKGENAIEIDDIVVTYDDPFAGKWD